MLERQKELHPDKFGSKGENEVALARELSGRVNEAFGILVDPLKRAEYIVSRDGLHSSLAGSISAG
jgi:molecular chaperone HscB